MEWCVVGKGNAVLRLGSAGTFPFAGIKDTPDATAKQTNISRLAHEWTSYVPAIRFVFKMTHS